jgi:hypothetical protein
VEELQTIVDSLADRLGISVAVDDPRIRLRAYSAHRGHVDQVRMTSILTRSVPPEVAAWVFGLGISGAVEPVRIPANPQFDLEPRLCVPIRREHELLGFLWLIEPDGPFGDEVILAAAAAAEAAAEVMYRDRLLDDLRLGRERELVRDLLSESAEIRGHAAKALVEEELMATGSGYHALAIRFVSEGEPPPNLGALIQGALDETRSRHSRRHLVPLGRLDHGLVVLVDGDPSLRANAAELVAREIQIRLEQALAKASRGRALVGIGDGRDILADLRDSYAEAEYAIRVATVVSSYVPVAAWDQLGIYRMLIRFPIQELTEKALPDGLLRLMQRSDAGVWLKTLETYLDLAGSAPATALALHVHRVSLYARLRKIEEVAGIDLGDGQQRLALHLGVKLARLAGLLRSGAAG